jgi:hypothetical protein
MAKQVRVSEKEAQNMKIALMEAEIDILKEKVFALEIGLELNGIEIRKV